MSGGIVAINRALKVALYDGGECVPFETYIDCNGEVTDDYEDAIAVVLQTPQGHWTHIVLADYEDAGKLN